MKPILPYLPAMTSCWRQRDAVPADLIGAEIVAFGALDADDIEGGGLAIDYRKGGDVCRIVFAFTDEGIWVHHPPTRHGGDSSKITA